MFQKLVTLLIDCHLTLSSSESLTGGLFAKKMTDIPGASKAFAGGIVTYATWVKVQIGGVNQDIIDRYGVVSPETAQAMSLSCQTKFNTDIAVSFTGNAGPTAQDGKPVGCVFCYIAIKNKGFPFAFQLSEQESRANIRNKTVDLLAKNLLILLEKNTF